MLINKTSTVEFYRFEEVEKGNKDSSLFAEDLKTYSSDKLNFSDACSVIFQFIKLHVEKDDKAKIEKIIRNKKHKLWIDDINTNYVCGFATKENQNGVIIDKESFEITLAQDEKIDFELASMSHFVLDVPNKILALETFSGGVSKTGLSAYLNEALSDANFSITLTAIPRDDLEQILNDVKSILKFKAKYRDIKRVAPELLGNVFSKSKALELVQQNNTYETMISIDFGKGEAITKDDTIIQRLFKTLIRREPQEDSLLDGKIEICTKNGSEELIEMQENIFIEKMQVNIDDKIATREEYSAIFYDNVKSKIEFLLGKLNQ